MLYFYPDKSPLVNFLSETNQAHIQIFLLPKIYINVILPSAGMESYSSRTGRTIAKENIPSLIKSRE
jgi:hypothetical protein